jgi:hypothetical protein
MRNIFSLLCDFFFLFFNEVIGIASKSKLKNFKYSNCFSIHNCFYHFYFSIYFIIIASSCIIGNKSDSQIFVGKDIKPPTGIGIGTDCFVYLEVNTHTGTLDYFMNDKHIKDRVVNVPRDVFFGV